MRTEDYDDGTSEWLLTVSKIVAIFFLAVVLLVWLALNFIPAAHAHWKPEYASQPQEVQDWYQNAELTPEARKRFGFKSCCAHSDVVHTRFRVTKGDGADEWDWLDGSAWRQIPSDIIHNGEHAPDGQPTLFVVSGNPVCFWPPEGGI